MLFFQRGPRYGDLFPVPISSELNLFKIYGVHMLDKFPHSNILPITEDAPVLPQPWLGQLFYYNQIDCLKRMSQGKRWHWCEVRPDNIVSHSRLGASWI